jgi:hypothetical protein
VGLARGGGSIALGAEASLFRGATIAGDVFDDATGGLVAIGGTIDARVAVAVAVGVVALTVGGGATTTAGRVTDGLGRATDGDVAAGEIIGGAGGAGVTITGLQRVPGAGGAPVAVSGFRNRKVILSLSPIAL